MKAWRAVLGLALAVLLSVAAPALGQQVGDTYVLSRPGRTIPGHPGPGELAVSVRYPDGSIARIIDFDAASGWFEVEVEGEESSWIVKKYYGAQVETIPPGTPPSGAHTVGTWNLEWLKDGKSRGFPENTFGGPSYPDRTVNDYAAIAEVISNNLQAAVLVLTEIGHSDPLPNDPVADGSQEMDRLLEHLGPSFDYLITDAGKDQRVAMLFDTRKARLNNAFEIPVPFEKVDGKDIFARDPLVAHFTFLQDGMDNGLNDFVLVGLHLASGQSNNKNHDRAMDILRQNLAMLLDDGEDLPPGELDIVITGDLNLNIFDNKKEKVLEKMEDEEYDILAEEGYPATRLKGVPLSPGSLIDYIIVTDEMRAAGKEVAVAQATVHQDLAGGDFEKFREHFSDHFPVTVALRILEDDD